WWTEASASGKLGSCKGSRLGSGRRWSRSIHGSWGGCCVLSNGEVREVVFSSILEVGTQHQGLRGAEEAITRSRPDLDESSATYCAAVVLLVAQVAGRGVHKLAKVTGYPSEFVARC